MTDAATEPAWLSAGEIAQGYRAGEFSPPEIVAGLLARIARLDPALNAFIRVDGEAAAEAAEGLGRELSRGRSRGPLHGVPVAIKDVIDVAGLPTTCHSRLLLDRIAREDAAVVARLRGAGAIVLGKLSTHEFAIGGPSFDLPFPPARNPWNPDHHPGGSSSGAGAAVAAGMVPVAVGTDTGGSVRNPASACGIVGLKPTYGLVSRRGVFPLAFSLDHVGPLTRTVADAALALDAMAGHDPADIGSVPGGSIAAGALLGQGVRGLRIGVVRHFHETDMPAAGDVADAFEGVVRGLAGEGAVVSAVTLPSLNAFATVNRVILQAEGYAVHAPWLRTQPEAYGGLTRRGLLPGAFLTAEDYVTAQRRRRAMIEAVEAAFADHDVLLTASSLETPCRLDDPAEIDRTYPRQARTPFNVTGHPALAMRSGFSAAGLPLSVQFVARAFAEATLLRAAAAWERIMGPAPRPPL